MSRWHGYQIVYTEPVETGKLWGRHVIDDDLRWGHAVWCADLDNDGDEELIIGVRDDPAAKDKVTDKSGVRIYEPLDAKGSKWARQRRLNQLAHRMLPYVQRAPTANRRIKFYQAMGFGDIPIGNAGGEMIVCFAIYRRHATPPSARFMIEFSAYV